MKSKETLSEAWRRESDELLRQGQEGAVQHCVALAMGCRPELRADVDLHRAAAVKLLWRGARAGEASTKVLRLPYDGVSPEEEQKLAATFGREAADAWWVTEQKKLHDHDTARVFEVMKASGALSYGQAAEMMTEIANHGLEVKPPKRQPPIPWEYIAGCLTKTFDCEVGPEMPNGSLVVRHYDKDWQARGRSEDCPETMESLSHGLGISVGNLRLSVKCYRKRVQARQLQAERIQRAANEGREDYSQANIQEAAAKFMAEHGKPELIESGSMPCRNASALRPDQRDAFVREREVILNPPPGETFEAWQARTNLSAMTAEEIVYAINHGFLGGFPPGTVASLTGDNKFTYELPPTILPPAAVVGPSARAAQEQAAIQRAQLAYPTDGLTDANMAEIAKNQRLAEQAIRQARETLGRPAPPRFPKR